MDSVERSGGLAILWKEEVQFELYNFSLRHISGWIDEESNK